MTTSARDFDLLRDAGLLRLAAPREAGGLWESADSSARRACEFYRRLASADPSVVLLSSMHPSVIAFWLVPPDSSRPDWEEQRHEAFASAVAGEKWGTIPSEPGSGGISAARGRSPYLPTSHHSSRATPTRALATSISGVGRGSRTG